VSWKHLHPRKDEPRMSSIYPIQSLEVGSVSYRPATHEKGRRARLALAARRDSDATPWRRTRHIHRWNRWAIAGDT
jgi:hypothetical protein